MLMRTILNRRKGDMFLCVDASVCGEEHLEEQGLINHAQGLNIEEDNEEDAVKGIDDDLLILSFAIWGG